ncbi:hypothetical protein Dimus_021414 [Dionaea muscipula]
MSREGEGSERHADWFPVVRRRRFSNNNRGRIGANNLITLFVVDLPDSLDQAEVAIQKINGTWIKDKELKVKIADFARKIERKWVRRDRPIVNRMERYDANQRSNNVRKLGGNGNPGNRTSTRSDVKLVDSKAQPQHRGSQYRNGKDKRSYADVVNRGIIQDEEIPKVKGVGYGNEWLHRNPIASLGDH